MSRSEKLQPIAKIRKQQERNAGRVHGETMREVEQQQKQLSELIGYRDQYEKSFQTASASGLSVIRLQEYKIFLQRLDDAIAQQQQMVNNGHSQCEASQKEWMNKRSRRKMIDKVVENRQQEERLEAEKQEQRELEDRPQNPITR